MKLPNAVFVLILALCAWIGFGMRQVVLDEQYKLIDQDLPFTLESALQYRLTKLVYDGEGLPEVDPDVQFPDGINIKETYSVGAEYVYSALAKMMGDKIPLSKRIRTIATAIFCLGIMAIGFWAHNIYRSQIAGIIAALMYAICISSVIRSTGQELSRENLGLPLMCFFFAIHTWSLRRTNKYISMLSAIILGCSIMTWDLIQYIIGLWIVAEYLHHIIRPIDDKDRFSLSLYTGVLILLAWFNPYLRAHSFYMSPVVALLAGLTISCYFKNTKRLWRAAIPLMVIIFICLIGQKYSSTYGHFGELFKAKIIHGNVKPLDPGLLTYDQRIMWTPALDSATWALTKALFPALLVVSAISLMVHLTNRDRRTDFQVVSLICFFLISVFLYVLFVRFHVFVVLFAAPLLGGMISSSLNKKWLGVALGLTLFGASIVEAHNVLYKPSRWGRPNIYYPQEKELTTWLKENTAAKPVLASFRISGPILTYAGNPIILHPKFEDEIIRKRVQHYYEKLFKGTEYEFWSFANELGAEYYVYSMGHFAKKHPTLQARYMVDAMEPPESSMSRMMQDSPNDLRHFNLVYQNRKYKIFDIITQQEKDAAKEYISIAEESLQNGDLKAAFKWCNQAFQFDPKNEKGLKVYKHVISLSNKGL